VSRPADRWPPESTLGREAGIEDMLGFSSSTPDSEHILLVNVA
jgi:hypothetical protein